MTSTRSDDNLACEVNDFHSVKQSVEEKLNSYSNVLKENLNSCLRSIIGKIINEKLGSALSLPKQAAYHVKPVDFSLRISGIPEKCSKNYNENLEHDANELNEILQSIDEYEPNCISSEFRLSKPARESPATRPRTLLLTFTNLYAAEKCLAKSSRLKSFKYPVYISKSLNQKERELEKRILSTRYKMITENNMDRSKFKIRNLKLFYDGQQVDLSQQ